MSMCYFCIIFLNYLCSGLLYTFTTMRFFFFSQTVFYWFNLRAYGNLHINCFMFRIIKMSGQIGNVKHGDIFIPCKFIAPFKN